MYVDITNAGGRGAPTANVEESARDATEIVHVVNGATGAGVVRLTGELDKTSGHELQGVDAETGGKSVGDDGVPTPATAVSPSAGRSKLAAGGEKCVVAHSDRSTDDGTCPTVHEYPHHAHWEEFTNNDIVDQVTRQFSPLSCCLVSGHEIRYICKIHSSLSSSGQQMLT